MSSDPKPEAQKAEAQKPAAQQPDAQKADAQKPDAKQQEAAKGAAGGAPVDPKANKPRVFLINGREFSVDRRSQACYHLSCCLTSSVSDMIP